MSEANIADKNGKWYMNVGLFRMHDPLSNTYFEPGIPTKATETPWLVGSPSKGEEGGRGYKPGTPGQRETIVEIDDPTSDETLRRGRAVAAEAEIQKHGNKPSPKEE